MDLRNPAQLVAVNREIAAIVGEYVQSLINQGLTRQEAVSVAAVWQGTYLQLIAGAQPQA